MGDKFYPQDFALPMLVKKLGGATQFTVPPMKADALASLRNFFCAQGIKLTIVGDVWTLDATDPEWRGLPIDHTDHLKAREAAPEKEPTIALDIWDMPDEPPKIEDVLGAMESEFVEENGELFGGEPADE